MDVISFLESSQKYFTNIDYTPAAICLGKIFEKEINYSIVQLIRKLHMIELPTYFNKVQPNIEAKIMTSKGHLINLNDQKKNGQWKPPTIGTFYFITLNNTSKQDLQNLDANQRKTLFREWENICQIRNDAAHSEIILKPDIENLLNSTL